MTHTASWRRLGNARVSRRRALAGGSALAAAAGAAGIVGCGDDSPSRPPGPASGGTLRFGTTLRLGGGLDPHTETGTGLAIFPKVYGYALHVDSRDDSVILDHARSIEQPDDTTWIVHLRDDIHFHDVPPTNGRLLFSGDLVRSLERYRSNPLAVDKVWHSSIVDQYETPDFSSLLVKLKRPYVYTPNWLGHINAGAILPADVVDRNLSIDGGGAGSGPFIASSRSETDVSIRRNPGYFGEAPLVDAMDWRIFPSDDAKVQAMHDLEVDAAVMRDQTEARALSEAVDDIIVLTERSLASVSFGMRFDRAPFLDDRVREAIDLTIDRGRIIADIGFGDGRLLGPVNPHLADGFWSLPDEEIRTAQHANEPVEQRRARARALLEAAGAAHSSFKLMVADVPQLIDVATVVRDDLQQIGLDARIDARPLLAWFLNFRRGVFDAAIISSAPYESPDLPTRLFHSAGIDGTGNQFGFSDPDIDRLVERSWGETDRDVRRETLLSAQRAMMSARTMLQLFTGVGYAATWRYVQGRPDDLPGSLAQYAYGQWLALPFKGRPD
jgi:peptide/nickel transport system substrate-binding protein